MKVIGSQEKISILDLDLSDLDVKIDTGADGCSLHCDMLRISKDNIVSFRLLDKVHKNYNNKKFEFPLFKIKNIKSSNGEIEERPFIQVNVLFCDKKYKMTISLTDRSNMKFPMLIGKNFLKKKFLVDVSKKNIGEVI